jgi:S-(hydroxymethyl)glutathione dehydrogenase / alcohol dehydrogenase
MPTTAKIVLLPAGARELEAQTVTIPDPGPFEVVVEQFATGICHSQLDHIDYADPTKPVLLGHESAGVVTSVGSDVVHVRPGDEVLVTWLPRSAERKPNLTRLPLPDGQVAVTRNVFTWGTHTLADEQYVCKAPSGLPADLTSIIGCAVMTGAGAVMNTASLEKGKSAVVWGVGGVGLSAVSAARNLGASTVIAVDIDDMKLELAGRMGADQFVNAAKVDPVDELRRLTPHDDGTVGADYSFDCTGRPDNVAKSVAAVRPGVGGKRAGGMAVMVGAVRTPFSLPGMELINGEKILVGSMGGGCSPDRDFPVFLDWFQSGQLDLASLVTNRYSFDQLIDGVADLREHRVGGRAVVVV